MKSLGVAVGASSGVIEAVADGVGVQSAAWVEATVSVMVGSGEVDASAVSVSVPLPDGSVEVRVAVTVGVVLMTLSGVKLGV